MRSVLKEFIKFIAVGLLGLLMGSIAFADNDTTMDVASDQSADPSATPGVTSTMVSETVDPATSAAPAVPAAPAMSAPAAATPAKPMPSAPAATSAPTPTPPAANPAEVRAEYDKLINDAGVTYNMQKPSLDITVNEKKALDALPGLEEQGMINGKIPPADVAAMPISISGALIGVSFAAVIVHTEFEMDNALDKLHVQVFLLPKGSKSDADKQLCYSFDFTRALFNKTNWDTVTPKDIMLNSPNFKFSSWCQDAIDKESSMKQPS